MVLTLDFLHTTLYTRVIVNFKKRMKKATILRCIFLHQYLDFLISPLHPAPFEKFSGIFYFILFPMLVDKRAPPFCHCFFSFQLKKIIYIFVEILFFIFVFVHTLVRQVINYYIIMYTMKKHPFTWTSVFNCLISLLSFFLFNITITYYDTTYLVFSLYTTLF